MMNRRYKILVAGLVVGLVVFAAVAAYADGLDDLAEAHRAFKKANDVAGYAAVAGMYEKALAGVPMNAKAIQNEFHHTTRDKKIRPALERLGACYIAVGQFEKALNVLNLSLEITSFNHDYAHDLLAFAHAGLGDFAKAEEQRKVTRNVLKMKIQALEKACPATVDAGYREKVAKALIETREQNKQEAQRTPGAAGGGEGGGSDAGAGGAGGGSGGGATGGTDAGDSGSGL